MLSFIFPGQGAQVIGMGRELAQAFPVAAETFQRVDDALGRKLSHLVWEGAADDLNLTENTQPALMTASLAAFRVLEHEYGKPLGPHAFAMAGHSLGEYTALAAAGSLTLEDTARLLQIRAQAMQAATPVGTGAMLAVIGLDIDACQTLAADAAQDQVCVIANDNCPGQQVLSGHIAAIDRAEAAAKPAGARMSVRLNVSAPFHSPLMAPAMAQLEPHLHAAAFGAPACPIVTNVTAQPQHQDFAPLLTQQVAGSVRWRESMETLLDLGVRTFIEVGPGKVLSGLGRRISGDALWLNFFESDTLEEILKTIDEVKS